MSNGLAHTSVRFRPASFAGMCVALAFAAAIVTACGTLLQTGITARVEPVRYANAPVVVAADQLARITVGHGEDATEESTPLPDRARLDAGLAGRIAEVPGVADAVADVAVPVQATDGPGRPALPALVGRDWPATRITAPTADPLTEGRAPAGGEVVLDAATAREAGLGVGDEVRLTAPVATSTYRIVGLAAPQAGDATAWFADGTSGRLAGHPGQADAIAVFPGPGVSTDRLEAQVRDAVADADGARGVRVYTGDGRGELEEPQLAEAREVLMGIGGSFGGVATLTAVFVVMGTVSLAIGQRSREIALLRAVGATPRQIRRTVATEALLVAPLAGAVGVLPGIALARWWFDQLVARGAVPRGVELSTGPIPVVTAIGAGLLAALIAGYLAARRPSKASPSRALGDAAVARRRPGLLRTLLGVGALAGAIALAGVASTLRGDDAATTALGIVMLFMLAVALLGPVVAWLAATVLGLPLRASRGAPAALAAANTRAESRRLASAITPIALVVAFCGTLFFFQTSMRHTSERQVDEGLIADHVVTARGAGLPAGLDRAAAAAPGVDAAVGVLQTGVLYRADGELNEASALGVTGDASDIESVLALDVEEGTLADLTPAGADVVALDTLVADGAHVSVGDRVDLRLGDGTRVQPLVVATYSRGLGLGGVVMPRAALAGHVAAPYDSQILVADAPGADPAAVARRLGRLDAPGLVVRDRAGYAAQLDEDAELNAWANNVMTAVLGGFAAVAAANTLVMVVLDRRREVSLLRLAGTTRRQVMRMLRWEALVVTGAGLLVGGAIAWMTLTPLARGATGSGPYVPPGPALAMAGGVVLLGVLATALPGRSLLRPRPA
jgi:putative ABC transport system permease protein